METLIECGKIDFGYGKSLLIKNLNFKISQGEFLGIVGPNGSGKSTILKLLSGILEPVSGEIVFRDSFLQQIQAKQLARQMAVVPQSTELPYDFSVYEIVAMGRYPHQGRWSNESSADKKIIQAVMKQTGVWQFKDQNVNALSGGERQRVIIARALAQEPEIILLDEPTSNLDINYQIEIFDLLQELNKQGMTIAAVLHDLNLASQYCNRLMLLSNGQIYASGTPDEVINVKNIRNVYNTEVIISKKFSGRPYVTLVSRRALPAVKDNLPKIHLVCGGGSGHEIINWLLEEGFPVSGGVLNQGDSDWQLLMQNDRPVVEEKPFSPILSKTYKELIKIIEAADQIIMTDLPFGAGNLANLEAVYQMWQSGKPVYIYQNTEIENRDFTGGKATKIYNKLISEGVPVIEKMESLKVLLNRR